jgi:beta-lactamase regulating signal transducer with metallopeptidase domain
MEAFSLYLFKSVIWLAGFALVFILFLRNERFFYLNRIYLIAGILTSFFFPLISIHYTVVIPATTGLSTNGAVISQIQESVNGFLYYLKIILPVLYLAGVLAVVTVIVRQGRSVLRAIKKSEVISAQPVKLVKTTEYASAFSFFSYVFVNPSVTDIESREIMIHELVHIRQKHWFDLLLVELLCMMQWFNPLVWMYVRFIRQNHEYLADEVALQQTSDPAVYKAVLLNQIVGAPVVGLTNSFNYSPNKKRFNMMKNIITSPYRKMKVLLILPVFAIVLYSFAKPVYKYNVSEKNNTVLQDTVKKAGNKSDVPPPPPPPPPVPAKIDAEDIAAPAPVVPPPTPLFVVDGVIVNESAVKEINPTNVVSVNVIKEVKPATEKYGEKGKNGVVEIVTNSNESPVEFTVSGTPAPDIHVKSVVDAQVNVSVAPEVKIVSADGKVPLIVVDGVLTDIDINSIEASEIESISVFSSYKAVNDYGEKGKDGVIVIKMKK